MLLIVGGIGGRSRDIVLLAMAASPCSAMYESTSWRDIGRERGWLIVFETEGSSDIARFEEEVSDAEEERARLRVVAAAIAAGDEVEEAVGNWSEEVIVIGGVGGRVKGITTAFFSFDFKT